MNARNIWAIVHVVVLSACSTYWITTALKHIWPAALFAVGWSFYWIDGTINEVKAYKARNHKMDNSTFLLFTYGTLMKGQRNEHLLSNAKYVGKAVTKPIYKLFRIDGNFVFPAIIDEGNMAVNGEVYEVPMSALAGMDRMEGHPHFYCRKPISLDSISAENGSALIGHKEVIAYFFVDKEMLVQRYPEIKSGDWLNR